jgi:hypothetical protein
MAGQDIWDAQRGRGGHVRLLRPLLGPAEHFCGFLTWILGATGRVEVVRGGIKGGDVLCRARAYIYQGDYEYHMLNHNGVRAC